MYCVQHPGYQSSTPTYLAVPLFLSRLETRVVTNIINTSREASELGKQTRWQASKLHLKSHVCGCGDVISRRKRRQFVSWGGKKSEMKKRRQWNEIKIYDISRVSCSCCCSERPKSYWGLKNNFSNSQILNKLWCKNFDKGINIIFALLFASRTARDATAVAVAANDDDGENASRDVYL